MAAGYMNRTGEADGTCSRTSWRRWLLRAVDQCRILRESLQMSLRCGAAYEKPCYSGSRMPIQYTGIGGCPRDGHQDLWRGRRASERIGFERLRRSEARRLGKECVSTCRSRGSLEH